MPQFALGWKRQAPDSRDRKLFFPSRFAATNPPSIDLSANLPVQDDQADLGACGPSTCWEHIQFDQKASGMLVVPPSRLFVYYATRILMGTVDQDSGVDNRTMCKALNQYGFCDESLWSYNTSKFTQKPPQACFDAAKPNCITNYAAVQQTIDQMESCLSAGLPFIFGFDVFQSMMSESVAKTGIVPDPKHGESPVGGHDVLIFSYDRAKQQFGFRNHWKNGDGSWWGANGNGFISYKYASNPSLAGDFWVINAVPGKLPTPTPPTRATITLSRDMKAGTYPVGSIAAMDDAPPEVPIV